MSVKLKVESFGFDPRESEHYFMVSIPSTKDGVVQISEHMSWSPDMWERKIRAVKNDDDERLRVVLSREKWDAIADFTRNEFNRRLRNSGQKSSKWKMSGLTPISRLYGKELVLLAWAVEDADPSTITIALRNWQGLTPEERWWLFTMTNAATGQAIHDKNKGWRKALRYALTENPVTAAQPEQRMGLIIKMDEMEGLDSHSKKKRQQGKLSEFYSSIESSRAVNG